MREQFLPLSEKSIQSLTLAALYVRAHFNPAAGAAAEGEEGHGAQVSHLPRPSGRDLEEKLESLVGMQRFYLGQKHRW
jgi:hypothetical protein